MRANEVDQTAECRRIVWDWGAKSPARSELTTDSQQVLCLPTLRSLPYLAMVWSLPLCSPLDRHASVGKTMHSTAKACKQEKGNTWPKFKASPVKLSTSSAGNILMNADWHSCAHGRDARFGQQAWRGDLLGEYLCAGMDHSVFASPTGSAEGHVLNIRRTTDIDAELRRSGHVRAAVLPCLFFLLWTALDSGLTIVPTLLYLTSNYPPALLGPPPPTLHLTVWSYCTPSSVQPALLVSPQHWLKCLSLPPDKHNCQVSSSSVKSIEWILSVVLLG